MKPTAALAAAAAGLALARPVARMRPGGGPAPGGTAGVARGTPLPAPVLDTPLPLGAAR